MSIRQKPEGIKLLELTPEKGQFLWDTFNQIQGIFDDYHKDRADLFLQRLLAPDTVWLEREDGNGVLYLTEIIRGLSAVGHIVYWDKRLRGREEFTLDCLRWLMDTIPLQKVNVFLPDFAKTARSFTERMGFKQEGKIRNWTFYDAKLHDVFLFGITREEALASAEKDELVAQEAN